MLSSLYSGQRVNEFSLRDSSRMVMTDAPENPFQISLREILVIFAQKSAQIVSVDLAPVAVVN